MIFHRRDSGEDPRLLAKGGLLVLGAGLGIAGMAKDIDWLVIAGIVVLAFGVVLRFMKERKDD